MSKVFAYGPGDRGSIPDRVIPKTQKMVLDAAFIKSQHYRVKWSNLGNGVVPFPIHYKGWYAIEYNQPFDTWTKTFFPILETVLEVFNWHWFSLLHHNQSHVPPLFRMAITELGNDFGGKTSDRSGCFGNKGVTPHFSQLQNWNPTTGIIGFFGGKGSYPSVGYTVGVFQALFVGLFDRWFKPLFYRLDHPSSI